MTNLRTCPFCAAAFVPKNAKHIYCQPKCIWAAYSVRKGRTNKAAVLKAWTSVGKSRTCPQCNKSFTVARVQGRPWRFCSVACNTAYHNRIKKRATPEDRRRYHLLRLYGITLEDYANMLKNQNGVCAICKKRPTDKNLHVDHDHSNGRVRGLLCYTCNTRLGWFELYGNEAFDYLIAEEVI